MRHARALAQAITDILSDYGYTKANSFLRYYQFYLKQLEAFDAVKVMKQIKSAINHFCARRLRQPELPEASELRLFPRSDVVWIKHKTQIRARGGKTRRLQLIHSIAQCKNVLEGPSREFYQAAYEKHAATLSKPSVRTPVEILAKAYQKGKEFGKRVKTFYKPHKGYMPSGSATFDVKRREGGKKSVLFKKNTQTDSSYRVEPTVLFIHGEPGVGKSRLLNEVVRTLCEREQMDFSTCTYTRNCNTAHWDGYHGQSVVILDDWGQDVRKSEDVLELIALVTENAYPLPMADLREKGTLFTSRFLIICSNTFSPMNNDNINVVGGSLILRNVQALTRRLHHRYYICDARSGGEVTYTSTYDDRTRVGGQPLSPLINMKSTVSREVFLREVVETLVQDALKRSVGLLRSIPEIRNDYPWAQSIYNDNVEFNVNGHNCTVKGQKTLFFPCVPDLTQTPKVRTSAVSKPLGTRMVTCGSEELHVLKPFQVAMWKALGTYKKFQPTHGVSLSDCLPTLGVRDSGELILSGDYESATDGMNMDLSNALLNGILSEIDHEPTKVWAVYENGMHEVHYPSWTGIQPVTQTTGQLMGSLLSFPLLCLANDLITDLAGITTKKLINGDDLLAHASQEKVDKWKEIGTICGMKPSVGKNYTSKIFGTFNSQLIVHGRHVPYTNLKLVSRKEQIGNCAKIAQSLGISKRLMVKRSKTLLLQTPQSLDVSYSKGGLGWETTKDDSKISMLDKICYLSMLLKKEKYRFKSLGLPAGYKWQIYPTWDSSATTFADSVPSFMTPERMDLLACEYLTTQSKDLQLQTTLSYRDITKVKKKIFKNPLLRDMLYNAKFSALPEVKDIGYKIQIVHKKAAEATFNSRMREFLSRVQYN